MKKILLIILCVFMISTGFSRTTWSVTCTQDLWPACGVNYGCGGFASGSGCAGGGLNWFTCNPVTDNTGTCTCTIGYEDCNNNGGCETNINTDESNCGSCGNVCPSSSSCVNGVCTCNSGLSLCSSGCLDLQNDENNCGSCGNDCGSAPCVNGVCQSDVGWSFVTVNCLWFGDDRTGFEDTYVEERGYNCQANPGYCYENINPTTNLVPYNGDCFGGWIEGYARCDEYHLDCNGNSGCETYLLSPDNCGSCGNTCWQEGCSASDYLVANGETFSEQLVNIVCDVRCATVDDNTHPITADCASTSYYALDNSPYTKGYCETNSDCFDGGGSPIVCASDTDGEGWCCFGNECGHDGSCYGEDTVLPINNIDNICVYDALQGGMVWKTITKTLSLSDMIKDQHGIVSEDKLYFTHTGITSECDSFDYRSCEYDGPFYAYKYCSSISTVFDGMFSLEMPYTVPVLVSEQQLYNPYGNSEAVIDLNGCSGGLNC